MSKTAILLDSFDTSTIGLIVDRVEGWRDAPRVRYPTVPRPNRVSAILANATGRYEPRFVRVAGWVRRDTLANCRAAIDELQERLHRGDVSVAFNDEPTRALTARLEEWTTDATPPQFASPAVRVSFGLMCPDPRRYHTSASNVSLSNADTAVPQGTAPVEPVITINGAATNPELIYKDSGGVEVRRMTFTVALAGGHTLRVDCNKLLVELNTGGGYTNAIDLLTGGDFLVFDPRDGVYPSSQWPTLRLTVGTGSADYNRAYL